MASGQWSSVDLPKSAFAGMPWNNEKVLTLLVYSTMRKLTVIICFTILGGLPTYAQKIAEKGVPWIDNYTTAQYRDHGKIWDITSAENGLVYMAGDAGLLEYDGQTWNQFKGSEGYTRSLLFVNDSVLYSGSDLDFGIWKKNRVDQFTYTSIYPFSKDPKEENEEFWDIYQIKDKVIFVSFTNIYVYQNKQLTKIAAPARFSSSFQCNGKIYLSDEKNDQFVFDGFTLKLLFRYPGDIPVQITGLYEKPNGLMIVTKDQGLFLYDSEKVSQLETPVSDHLKKDQVFCSVQINGDYYAFGTILNGLYITDLDGNIIQHINRKKGLLNNTVLSMHYTSNGMLWLGMDYGIAAVHLFSGITYFFDYQGDYGSAQTALLHNEQFYLGTNQGLYNAKWQELNNQVRSKPFTLVQGSEGQVWSLGEIDGTILCGHDKGLFAVSGNTFRRMHNEPGVWTFLTYKNRYLLTGNYNGVSVFKMEEGKFVFIKKLALILGSCNQLLVEKDNILWVNIPNYGLIRFTLNSDFDPENRSIFPASLFTGKALFLQKDKNGINLLTDEFRYLYSPQKKQFIQQGANESPKNITGLQNGVYAPIPLNDDFQFYPIYNGFAFRKSSIDPRAKKAGFSLLLRNAEAFNNHSRQLISRNTTIPYALNNLNFHYIVPHKTEVLYQYQLLNYSEDWSAWTTNNSVDFLNLDYGRYTLKIRAKHHGEISPATAFSFSVSPPWYRTKFAYLGYIALAAILYFFMREWQNYRLREQKKVLLEQKQNALRKQADKYEQEALLAQQRQLEDEKKALKQQVKQKSIELAKQARDNENQNRLLRLLKEKMGEAQPDPAIGKMQWAEINRLLDLYLESDDKTFEIQIDELHQELFQKLREQFPDLSLYDLRLCAYLKIGLDSKEISEILKVLPSSINVSRSRLRKKLNLRHDQDLYGFLNQVR